MVIQPKVKTLLIFVLEWDKVGGELLTETPSRAD
jgi:hypothetical protein